eukprot:4579768-Prorocentrum_lima.AAC.1
MLAVTMVTTHRLSAVLMIKYRTNLLRLGRVGWYHYRLQTLTVFPLARTSYVKPSGRHQKN